MAGRAFRRRRRLGIRGIAPIIATVFLVAMTVAVGAILYLLRPPLPPVPSTIDYQVITGSSIEAWGDGSDCKTVNSTQSCLPLPAIQIVLTDHSPQTIFLSTLTFYLMCNGTVYLQASLPAMEVVPGSTASIPSTAPQLGYCGSYVPPKAAFNRLAFFDQLAPGSTTLQAGDTLVLYAHTFEPPNCPSPTYKNGVLVSCDDDFHGAPPWCYSVPNACQVIVYYTGPPSVDAVTIPLYGLSD